MVSIWSEFAQGGKLFKTSKNESSQNGLSYGGGQQSDRKKAPADDD